MKEIILTQGKVALVDDEDFEWLNKVKWHARKGPATYYAARGVNTKGKIKIILMHRVIMNAPKGMQVDHKDRNGLNCQKSNMRNCTHGQNQMNKVGWGASRYKGVSFWQRGRGKVLIKAKIKKEYLGLFPTEEAAALAYNERAKELFGEFAKLNII